MKLNIQPNKLKIFFIIFHPQGRLYGLRRLSIKSFGLVKKGKYLKAFEDYIICIFSFYTGLLRLMKRLSRHAIRMCSMPSLPSLQQKRCRLQTTNYNEYFINIDILMRRKMENLKTNQGGCSDQTRTPLLSESQAGLLSRSY